MKLLFKYYRWRLKSASEIDKTKWKYKIYKVTTYKNDSFGGLDLTFFPGDTKAYKEELTAGIGEAPVNKDNYRVRPNFTWAGPGRYANGPLKYVIEQDTGNIIDMTDWRVTQLEWADDKVNNEKHMPTRLTRKPHKNRWKYNPITKKFEDNV